VVEEVADDTHVIVLQVPLGKDEFQDVATIEVEKAGEEDYNLQVHGSEVVYGVNYYLAPVRVRIHAWPIIAYIYRPAYRPYRSAFTFGTYPRWWKPFRPVAVKAYHARTVKFRGGTFAITKTARVTSITRVKYHPRTSTLVKKKTTITRTKAGKQKKVTKTNVKKRGN